MTVLTWCCAFLGRGWRKLCVPCVMGGGYARRLMEECERLGDRLEDGMPELESDTRLGTGRWM